MRSNRDDAGRALYDERRKLLAGLMMSEAEPWEDLPEDVKERWRQKTELSGTQEGSRGPRKHLRGQDH